MSKKFAHLHVHSSYSLLDGISQRADLIAKAKQFGQPGLAMTEHGNIFAAISFYKDCLAAGVVPVIGMEAYVAPDTRFGRTYAKKGEAEEDAKNGDLSMSAYHLTILSKNRDGYENLKRLSTLAYREGFYRKPRIDDEILEKHKEGLIVLSGCLASKTSRLIVAGQTDRALEEVDKMRRLFGDDFFLEVMDHNIDEEKVVRGALIEFGNKHGIGMVMTGDSHFTEHGDAYAHEIALAIGVNKTINDEDRWKFNGSGYWFKSTDEMAAIAEAADIPESALSNTYDLVKRVQDYGFDLASKKTKPRIPLFRDEAGNAYSNDDCHLLLHMKAFNGMAERGVSGIKEYEDRLTEEIEMIKSKDFSSYFLIIADIVDFMRSKGILAPIGRGSSVGSLTCYSLFITGLDPVKYNVPFSRFINPGRKDLPDIDTDISQERRKEVIDYIASKYGADRVAQIATYQTMGAKAAVDNVGRALGVPSSIRRMVGKIIGDITKDDHLLELLDSNPRLKEEMQKVPNWIDVANTLEGNNRNLGAHAAGIVISNEPLIEHTPLVRDSKEGHLITQYDMKDLSELGLLKLDMLGLKTMDIIQHTLELIKIRTGKDIDFQKIPTDDPATYELIATGKFVSVFQYDSGGLRAAAKQLQPNKYDHLVALNALYRPGPMLKDPATGKSILDQYVDRRHGREAIDTWHHELDEVFAPTLGLCIDGDMPITMADGSLKLLKTVVAGDMVLSSGSMMNVVHKNLAKGTKPCIKITTRTGHSVVLTEDHVLMVNGEEHEAGSVELGDFLSIPYRSLPTDSQTDLSDNQTYCIGLLLGDGSMNASTPVLALGNDESWRKAAIGHFIEAWPALNPIEFHNTRCFYLSLRQREHGPDRNVLSTALSDLGLRDVTCKNTFVPEQILNGSDSIKLQLLAGLWDSDGTITNAVHYTSESKELIKSVDRILSHFRISHYISDTGNRVLVRDVARFFQLVPLRHPNKQTSAKRNSTWMRFSRKHLRDAMDKFDGTKKKFGETFSVSRSTRSNRRPTIAKKTADRIDPTLYTRYYVDNDSDVVSSIERVGDKEVYDLVMMDSTRPWFTAGGILVHNCIFQEQVMNLTKIISGFNDLEADEYRAAIGKKDKVKFEAAQNKFIQRGVDFGRDPRLMKSLADKLEGFARYGWNIGHSLAYSFLSYVTAYLEAHFPCEYYTNLLNVNLDDSDQLKVLLSAVLRAGVHISPPDINKSGAMFHTDGKSIYMGLLSIRGLGEIAYELIMADRKNRGLYASYIDFIVRMADFGKVNKVVKCNLVKAGAFTWDKSLTDKSKIEVTDLAATTAKKFHTILGQADLLKQVLTKLAPLRLDSEWSNQEKLAAEQSVLNFYITSHPVSEYAKLFDLFDNYNFITPGQLQEQSINQHAVMLGVVDSKIMKMTKYDKPYVNLVCSDQFSAQHMNIWEPLASKMAPLIVPNQMIILIGSIRDDRMRPGENQLSINNVIPLTAGGGIPIKEFVAADHPTAMQIGHILGAEIGSISQPILKLGCRVVLSKVAYMRPEHFDELKKYKNRTRYELSI